MANLANPLARQFYPLAKDFKATDTTFDLIGRFESTNAGTYTIGKQMLTFSIGESQEKQEDVYIDVSSNPSDQGNGTYRYTVTSTNRAIDSEETVVPPTLVGTALKHPAGRIVGVSVSPIYFAQLNTEFAANVANRFLQAFCFDDATDVTVGDGRIYFQIPAKFDGDTLSIANATVLTAGTTGSTTIQIYNVTDSVDMLSTPITIASAATTGSGVIDATKDDVATGDILRIDVDTVSTTKPKGLVVNLEFSS